MPIHQQTRDSENRSAVCLVRAVFMVIFTIGLVGCATVPVPESKPVTEGIFSEPPSKSPAAKVPGGPDVSLGVILSQNTRASIAYIQKYQELARAGFGNPILNQSIRDAYELSADPTFMLHWIAASLKRHFGSVTVYEDINSLQAAQPDVSTILDLRQALMQTGNSDVSARVSAYFYDSKLRHIDESSGTSTGKTDTFGLNNRGIAGLVDHLYQQQHMLRVRALQQFDKSLDAIVAAPRNVTNQAPGALYDQCMERVLRISDPTLKMKAMAACDGTTGR